MGSLQSQPTREDHLQPPHSLLQFRQGKDATSWIQGAGEPSLSAREVAAAGEMT